jgi:hypothetical protein
MGFFLKTFQNIFFFWFGLLAVHVKIAMSDMCSRLNYCVIFCNVYHIHLWLLVIPRHIS